jgi:hypothetical protein
MCSSNYSAENRFGKMIRPRLVQRLRPIGAASYNENPVQHSTRRNICFSNLSFLRRVVLESSGVWRHVAWYSGTYASEKPVGPSFWVSLSCAKYNGTEFLRRTVTIFQTTRATSEVTKHNFTSDLPQCNF